MKRTENPGMFQMVGFELSLVRGDRLQARQRTGLQVPIGVHTGLGSDCYAFSDLNPSSFNQDASVKPTSKNHHWCQLCCGSLRKVWCMHLGRNDTSESSSSCPEPREGCGCGVRREGWGARGAGRCKEYQVEGLSHMDQWSGSRSSMRIK